MYDGVSRIAIPDVGHHRHVVCKVHCAIMPKARETCTECSLRRQRCNRQIPCDRCVRRGIAAACTRHWPERADPRCRALARPTRPATQRRGRTSRGEDLSSNVAGRDSPLSSESNAGGSAAPPSAGRCASTAFQPNSCGVCTNQQQCSLENANVSGSSVARPAPNRRGAPASTELGTLQLQLPDLNQIWHLVDFHERYLLWYHGCYHGPTFRSELKDALSNDGHGELDVASLNMQWLALLFAIMAGSLSCSPDTISSAWGFWKEEVPELSMQWYRATVTCLNLASYTTDHRLYSVQAITTLGMSAHTLGLSEDLSVLLAAALRIARSLGIDRIEQTSPSEEVNHDSTGAQRKQVLRREVGRRLWSQLCVQDWLAIPFQGSQCINLSDYTTSKPSNREFMTMDPLPANVPTYVSYGNYLYDIAKLIAEHHAAVARSSTPFTRYRRVLEFDARMKHLARRDMPEYFRVTMPVDPEWPEWVPWARRSLTICFAHKVLMIHRAFIRQSFTNAAFHVTRATCIAASTTILREAKIEMEEQGPIIWIDQVRGLGSVFPSFLADCSPGLLHCGRHRPLPFHIPFDQQ